MKRISAAIDRVRIDKAARLLTDRIDRLENRVREGDEYVVNGQKIWTSIAMWSKWIILLVRTQTDVEVKHDGITCLLVEMDSPGIEVRWIRLPRRMYFARDRKPGGSCASPASIPCQVKLFSS